MKLSCAYVPCKDIVTIARQAEDLGYDRIWLTDSPALYGDIWIALARIAENTERIGLGTAVAVPSLRHPMVTASAIASIEELAPGRLACAFGNGYTARRAMGAKPMRLQELKLFVEQLRALLRGETVSIDGGASQMIHSPGFSPSRPINVPILTAPGGPKGFELAREIADGVLCEDKIEQGFDWCGKVVCGTVLDAGETTDTPRVRDAAGPWFVSGYHAMWERDRATLAFLPGSEPWLQGIDAERTENERHLAVHEGHIVAVTDRDKPLIDAAAELIPQFTWTLDDAGIRANTSEVIAQGANDLIYFPAGSDIKRELTRFAQAVRGS